MDKNMIKKIAELEAYLQNGLKIIDKDKHHSDDTKETMKKNLIEAMEALKAVK
jgi:hypothetical protein